MLHNKKYLVGINTAVLFIFELPMTKKKKKSSILNLKMVTKVPLSLWFSAKYVWSISDDALERISVKVKCN